MNIRMSPRHQDTTPNYFISFTDLLVGILFLFIILIMAYAMNYQNATDGLLQAKRSLEERLGLLEQRVKVRSKMLDRLVEALGAEGVVARADYSDGVLRFDESILFDAGHAEIKDARAIRVLARLLEHELSCHGRRERPQGCPPGSEPILEAVYVEGHTDRRPTAPGSAFPSNWELSSARAISTYRALVGAQSTLEDLPNASTGIPLLGLSAYAERRPVLSMENLDQNRRIDIRFLLAPPTEVELKAARHGLR